MQRDIVFILADAAVPGNIGAAARAIKTMGFRKMRLVNPCDHLSEESRVLAHASNDILEEARIFEDLESALEGIDLSIATSAKAKDARVSYHRNTDLPRIINQKAGSVRSVGIVFGSEESGLSNEQIRLCDMASTIPLANPYPSLNLSQAVMLYAYTMADLRTSEEAKRVSPERGNDFRVMLDKSKEALSNLEIDKSPALYNRILERIAMLGDEDIHLLLSVLGRLK